MQNAQLDAYVSGATAGGAMTLYLTIALLLAGLLPAVLLAMTVDATLGYSPLEMGPRRRVQPIVRIGTSTFVAKAGIGAVTGFVSGSAVIAVALWGLDVEPDRPVQLWLFAGLTCAAVALLTLALFAIFGMAGQVIAQLMVTMFGIPLSGGTIPVQAQPAFAAAVGNLLPARPGPEGIRSLHGRRPAYERASSLRGAGHPGSSGSAAVGPAASAGPQWHRPPRARFLTCRIQSASPRRRQTGK
ncbi:hypothetical protein [Streptomyces sp. NPDC005969]|uniref:hypothetical protein n=1 Tax=Streptomyces sp. NPDC005969 TaxID=3156722 RepID=UPI0033C55B9E